MVFLNNRKKLLIICIAIPLAVGIIAGLLTRESMEAFEMLNQPPLSPPGWLFPLVWTALYILMGIASWQIAASNQPRTMIDRALRMYGIQLAFNFLWPIIFFNLKLYLFALIWLVILWILILTTIFRFRKISSGASCLLIPYLVWVSFAAYLNLGIYLLN